MMEQVNLPNVLTVIRILLVPVIVVALLQRTLFLLTKLLELGSLSELHICMQAISTQVATWAQSFSS